MDSYILKIYRKEFVNEGEVAGLLEGVLSGISVNFLSFEELRGLLLADLAMKRTGRGKAKRT